MILIDEKRVALCISHPSCKLCILISTSFSCLFFSIIMQIILHNMYSAWVISYFLIRKLHISRIAGVCILGILDIDKGTLFSWTNLNNAYKVHACALHKLIRYQGLTMYIIRQMRKTKHFTKLRRKHLTVNLFLGSNK